MAGRLAPGAHVIVTSRPHTLTYLQVLDFDHCVSLTMSKLLLRGLFILHFTRVQQHSLSLTLSCPIVSSDRSSYSDDGLLYIRQLQQQLFQIFTQSLDAIDVTSVTLSRLNSINVIDAD